LRWSGIERSNYIESINLGQKSCPVSGIERIRYSGFFYHIKHRRETFGTDEIVRFYEDSGIKRIRFRGFLLYYIDNIAVNKIFFFQNSDSLNRNIFRVIYSWENRTSNTYSDILITFFSIKQHVLNKMSRNWSAALCTCLKLWNNTLKHMCWPWRPYKTFRTFSALENATRQDRQTGALWQDITISQSNANVLSNWWKRQLSGSIACTRKQQPRFYWSRSSVVMNDVTPLTPPSAWAELHFQM